MIHIELILKFYIYNMSRLGNVHNNLNLLREMM